MATPSMPAGDYDDEYQPVWTPNIHGNSGSAGFVSSETRGKSAVRQLREVVAEVTNNRIPVPTKRKAGFY